MRKCFLVVGLFTASYFATAHRLHAQQPPRHETASQRLALEDEESALKKWKLINTGIFALLLGFGIIKLAPKFFQARSLDIQKAIKDATGLKIEADFRYSEIDKKMANLAGEVARMKAEAAAEMEREHQRLKDDTSEEIAHISRNTDYEIESLREEGALQVKRHTAQLALGLAEHRLQSHFARNDGEDNIREFLNLVGADKSVGGNN
jgi:F-type H+-transporting ATPase subunit b